MTFVRKIPAVKPKEQNIQSQLVRWMKKQYPKMLFTASAGGLHTSKTQAIKMKHAGYVAGCPDMMIFEPRGGYFGLFIEMKRPGNRATPDQLVFLENLRLRNYQSMVCTGLDEAMDQVSRYMAQEVTKLL